MHICSLPGVRFLASLLWSCWVGGEFFWRPGGKMSGLGNKQKPLTKPSKTKWLHGDWLNTTWKETSRTYFKDAKLVANLLWPCHIFGGGVWTPGVTTDEIWHELNPMCSSCLQLLQGGLYHCKISQAIAQAATESYGVLKPFQLHETPKDEPINSFRRPKRTMGKRQSWSHKSNDSTLEITRESKCLFGEPCKTACRNVCISQKLHTKKIY